MILFFMFGVIIPVAVGITIVATDCSDANRTEELDQAARVTGTTKAKKPPFIIWHYSGYRDKPESVEIALSSGLITHVNIQGALHRKDRYYKKNANILKTIQIAKNYGAKIIWSRWLWPGYTVEDSNAKDLFDVNFYIKEIEALREEAKTFGADFTGLDTEPYARSPMVAYKDNRITLKPEDRQSLKLLIKQVVNSVGTVDFIYPAGWFGNTMPCDIIAELGIFRVSEMTFYANYKRIKHIKVPYEIFGAYVNTTRENKNYPKLPYFTIAEIFDNSQLWSDKKGLFIYPLENKAELIAKDLVKYSRKLSFAKLSEEDSNNPNRE